MIRRRLRALLRSESGLGLVELLAAMMVLSIAIAAQLTVFSASFMSLQRAGRKGTALTLADKQMETYRTVHYSCVYLASGAGDSTYTSDAAYSATQVTGSTCSPNTAPPTASTAASQTVTGADGLLYRIDSYIVSTTPTGGRAVKKVTVVVRAITAGAVGGVLARESSTFDIATTT